MSDFQKYYLFDQLPSWYSKESEAITDLLYIAKELYPDSSELCFTAFSLMYKQAAHAPAIKLDTNGYPAPSTICDYYDWLTNMTTDLWKLADNPHLESLNEDNLDEDKLNEDKLNEDKLNEDKLN